MIDPECSPRTLRTAAGVFAMLHAVLRFAGRSAFSAALLAALLSGAPAWAHGGRLSGLANPRGLPRSASERAHELGYSLTPSTTEPYAACGQPSRGHASCLSIVVPPGAERRQSHLGAPAEQGPGTVSPSYEGSGERGGFSPTDLRSAYGISATGGSGQTVAIVDAFDDPNAEADLKTYRSHYGLSECTTANGCFKKVNQKGEAKNYPAGESQWAVETSLDIEMVSAICQECHIILVEAETSSFTSLDTAEAEAATLGATEISDSFGAEEFSGETSDDSYFNHPGVPITVSSGDFSYIPEYPSTSQYVISVGGTTLKKAEGSRGWNETVWVAAGSGCSAYEPKPAWQTDPSCPRRTSADVAAVADTESPVSVYDSYERSGWLLLGGTSVSAPIVAGVEAHASKAVREQRAEAFYRHTLFDVTSGANNWGCGNYLCTGEEGYDGPTGWGTPDGPLALTAGFHAVISTASDVEVGAKGARLNGYVNPEGVETTYQFEYGTSTSYGKRTPFSPTSVGSGVLWKAVSQQLTGLQEEVTYHYRLKAHSASGTVYSSDHTFTTKLWTAQKIFPNAPEETQFHELLETHNNELFGVSCLSPAFCSAVGTAGNNFGTPETRKPLAESWNGTEWSVKATPNAGGEGESRLLAVSCSSSIACTAVGFYCTPTGAICAENGGSGAPATVAERWNGSEWVLQTTPNPTGAKDSRLEGVACASSSACIAVGTYVNSAGVREAFAEQWNGTSWTMQTVPAPTGAQGSDLNGVSCVSSSVCTAVGSYKNSAGTWVTLAERWNGTAWAVQSTPSLSGTNSLLSVSCASTTACTAVGQTKPSGAGVPLAESWNGTQWSVQATPPMQPGQRGSALEGVSCISSRECVAVGSEVPESALPRVVAERWTGTEWVLQVTPEQPHANLTLNGVACFAPSALSACRAAGSSSEEGSFSGGNAFVENLAPRGAEWRLAGAAVAEPVSAGWKGKVKLTEGYGSVVECEDTASGPVDPGLAGEVTQLTASNCAVTVNSGKGGACKSGATIEALHLPWHSELVTSEGSTRDVLVNSGKGTPGYKLKCTETDPLGIKGEQECTGVLSTTTTNTTNGVTATFNPAEKLNCYNDLTNHEAGPGTIEGTQTIEASKGGRLSAVSSVEAGELSEAQWHLAGALLAEPVSVGWKGKVKLTEGYGSVVECEDTASGPVDPGLAGEVTQLTASNCAVTVNSGKGGACKSGATIEALHLPWHSELVTSEGSTRDVLVGSGKGTPGYKLKCTETDPLGIKGEQECTGVLSTTTTNTTNGVTATFNPAEKLNCYNDVTNHEVGPGTIEGTQTITASAGKLEAF